MDEDLSAGEEAAFLPADGNDRGFGQNLDQAVLLFRIEEKTPAAGNVARTCGARAVGEEPGDEGINPIAAGPVPVELGPELVEQRPGDLGHFHFEHDLLRCGYSQQIDDSGACRPYRRHCSGRALRDTDRGGTGSSLGIARHYWKDQALVDIAHVGFSDDHGLLDLVGTGYYAGEHYRIGGGAHPYTLFVGQQLRDLVLQQPGIEIDGNVDYRGLTALTPQDDVGRAEGLTKKIKLARADDSHVCNVRIPD